MKTMRKSLLIAMMVMATAVVFANGNKPNVKVEKIGTKMVSLKASQLGTSQTQVQLKNENGIVLHRLVLHNNEIVNKRFDLTSLPAGNYDLEVENETSFTTTPIEVSASAAFVLDADQVMIIKPVVRQNGDLLDIIMPSEDSTSVSVTIFDSNLNPVYKETVNGNTEMRRYDLSKLGKGGYRIKMRAQGKEFIQFVALK